MLANHCQNTKIVLMGVLPAPRPWRWPAFTVGYAADWTVEQLREPAQRIADRIDELSGTDVSSRAA